jgi:hypothetical protein
MSNDNGDGSMELKRRLAGMLSELARHVRTDVTAVKLRDGSSRWTNDPLTFARLISHVNGGPARGVCPIKGGESVTMAAWLDFDSHGGEVPWAEMVRAAKQVWQVMVMVGLRPTAWRSSGGRGIHLILLWEEPQDAFSVREHLRDVLALAGMREGARGLGVAGGEVEVFPKQNRVAPGGYGNQVILPLAGASELLSAGREDDGGDWRVLDREEAASLRWPHSAPVPVRQREAEKTTAGEYPTVVGSAKEIELTGPWAEGASGNRSEGIVAPGEGERKGLPGMLGRMPLAEVKALLDAIPNSGADELTYDRWRNVVFAVHHESNGSDEGLELAAAFSENTSHGSVPTSRTGR